MKNEGSLLLRQTVPYIPSALQSVWKIMSLHTYLYVVDGWFLFSYFMAEFKSVFGNTN
jgi:hypothetical protein